MSSLPATTRAPARIADICRRYRVRRLQMFGSTAVGQQRPDSDCHARRVSCHKRRCLLRFLGGLGCRFAGAFRCALDTLCSIAGFLCILLFNLLFLPKTGNRVTG